MTTAITPVPNSFVSSFLGGAAPSGGFTAALAGAMGGSDAAQPARESRTFRRVAGADSASDEPGIDADAPIDVSAMTANTLAVEELAPRIDAPRANLAPGEKRSTSPDESADPRAADTQSGAGSRTPPGHPATEARSTTASPSPSGGVAAARATSSGPASPPSDAERAPTHRAGRAPGGGSPNAPAVPATIASSAPARSDFPVSAGARPSLTAGPVPGVTRGPGQLSATRFAGVLRAPPRSMTLEAGQDPLAAQVARGLAAALRQNGGCVTLRLEPDALGALKVRLRLDAGRVEATFEAATDSARRLLDGALAGLRSALEAHGLAVDRLDVKLAERAECGGGQEARGPGVGPEAHAHGSADESGGDRPAGSEHPKAGGAARAECSFAEHSIAPEFEAEPVVTPEGVGVGAGGALIRLRLDAVA